MIGFIVNAQKIQRADDSFFDGYFNQLYDYTKENWS